MSRDQGFELSDTNGGRDRAEHLYAIAEWLDLLADSLDEFGIVSG